MCNWSIPKWTSTAVIPLLRLLFCLFQGLAMLDFYGREVKPRSNSPNSRQRREWDRAICRDLRELRDQTWGFTIFRTVFTPQSDARFALFLARLTTYVNYSIDSDLRPSSFTTPSTDSPLDTAPNEEMKRRFVNDIVEDRSLDGADTDAVRQAFTSWLKSRDVDIEMHQLYARHRVCIMVDEAVLESVLAASEEPSDDFLLAWVKVVEYLAPGEEEWQGWLKVEIQTLLYFWMTMFIDIDVEGLFTTMLDFGEEIYTG